MTIKSTRAMLAAALLGASATVAILAAPASAATLSEPVARHIQAAQAAATKQDFATAKTELDAARDIAKAPFDIYTVNRFTIAVDANTNDLPGAAKAAQAAADSPAQDDKEKPGNLGIAVQLSLATKDYPNASKYAKLLEATKPTDPKLLKNIGDAYYLSGDFAGAKTWANAQIAAAKAANKAPDKNTMLVLMSADVGLNDQAGAAAALEDSVAYYNDPADWAQLISVAITTDGIRDVEAVWLGRLAFLIKAPIPKDEIDMFGTISSHLTFFGDAVNAKANGGTIDPDPTPRADADKKTIQDQIGAENAQPGIYSAKLAEALYSYGMYPEAEAAANVALTKGVTGNGADASEAPMVLGQALAAQGKYADAKVAFAKVTGGGPATARITRLWVDYCNAKLNPPAAAPAQAAAK